jgi:pentatricopeptide repeat protein
MNGHMNVIIGSALVDMYAKCGEVDDACRVFDEMQEKRCSVTWGLMISMYTDNGCGHRALELFDIMQQDHQLVPTKATLLSALKACSDIGAIKSARMIHDEIIRREMDEETVLTNAVIDCYSRCGSMEEAHLVFDGAGEHDFVSWTALIVGYAHCADTVMVHRCLEDMQQEGLKLDELVFMTILVACRHSGLIAEACLYFRGMSEAHGITPSVDHYNCMIDILSRGGYMQEAEHLLRTMHLPPDLVGWRSLLSCCSSFENADLSLQCFDEVSKRDPINGSAYALMSNVYMNDHIGGVELLHDVDDPIHRSVSKPDCTNTFGIGANDDDDDVQKTMRNRFDSYIYSFSSMCCVAAKLHFCSEKNSCFVI